MYAYDMQYILTDPDSDLRGDHKRVFNLPSCKRFAGPTAAWKRPVNFSSRQEPAEIPGIDDCF